LFTFCGSDRSGIRGRVRRSESEVEPWVAAMAPSV
jgi:hypothetical protein